MIKMIITGIKSYYFNQNSFILFPAKYCVVPSSPIAHEKSISG